MTHAPLVPDSEVLLSLPSPLHKQERQGIFAAIVEALHDSRRLQAERYLRTNRHLIASSWDDGSVPSTQATTMAIAERLSTVKRSLKIRRPSESACLATLACTILLFNILVGVMVHRALPHEQRASTEEVFVSYGD